jgi:hypothetical protein
MKRFVRISPLALLVASLALGGGSAAAQMAGSPTGANVAISRLFGDNTAFSARADVKVLDESRTELNRLTMNFAMLDRSLRTDADMTQMSGRDVPADAVAQYKRLGVERVVSVIRPDKKALYLVFPSSRAYVNTPMTSEEIEASGTNLHVEKIPLGQETVDDHACTRNHVIVKGPAGVVLEAIAWNAADLKDFPIQLETTDKGRTVVMRFSQMQFTRPDAGLFELPPGYKGYKDPQALIESNAKRAGEPGR